MEDFINYLESWDFWLRLVWYSSAMGFGLALGFWLYEWVNSVVNRLFKLKFKKDKRKEK